MVRLGFDGFGLSNSVYIYWPNELSIRQWPGRPGFIHWSRHTKDFKNGT